MSKRTYFKLRYKSSAEMGSMLPNNQAYDSLEQAQAVRKQHRDTEKIEIIKITTEVVE